ncbi:MAG: hypothetical protein WBB01_14800 [Phormidesmis sp.]
MPKFATPLDRAKVEQLMQPALIRVIDNIRKQLDSTAWQGRYEEELIWPAGTTPEQQQDYQELQKQLHGVPPAEHDRVAALISQLPQPSPLYTLRLTKKSHADQTVDIWALCYWVCMAGDRQDLESEDLEIAADNRLFDTEGAVDWQQLDDKTRALVTNIFQALPSDDV